MYVFIYMCMHTDTHTHTLAQEEKQCRASYNSSKQQQMLVILNLAAHTFHIEIHMGSKDRQLPAHCPTQGPVTL